MESRGGSLAFRERLGTSQLLRRAPGSPPSREPVLGDHGVVQLTEDVL